MLSTDNVSSFFQTDGGPDGQEVSLFSLYNHQRKQVEQIWSSCTTVGGEFSEETAIGAKQRVNLFFRSANSKVDGICVDSGQGTSESLSKCMKELDLLSPFFNCDSCGLHDIQSVLRYPIQL